MSATLPLPQIRHALFEDERFASKVRADYGLPAGLRGSALESAMYRALEQGEMQQSVLSNRDVFRAAVRALASNSRAWSAVHANAEAIQNACRDFDPILVNADPDRAVVALTPLLQGQTRSGDVRAVIAWAALLSGEARYSDYLSQLARRCRELIPRQIEASDALVTALVATVGGVDIAADGGLAMNAGVTRKFPGMGAVLGSEFLRNLGWAGFKPDRHVMRLFDLWAGQTPEWSETIRRAREESALLTRALGRRSKSLAGFLYYSRLGELLTPPEMPVTRADQLVWLYGSIVEKKPRTNKAPEAH